MKSSLLFAIGVLVFNVNIGRAESSNCPSAREFITTLEFLRDQKEMKLPEAEARKLAESVAVSCEGSAKRFIRVTLLLTQSGFSAKDAVVTALDVSHRSDAVTDTFLNVFKTAFLQDHLDLDLASSLKMAKTLALDADSSAMSESKFALRDFQVLVDFCVGDGKLGLPKPLCGEFAARVARYGKDWEHALAPEFQRGYQFVVSESGPHLSKGEALNLSESLVKARSGAVDNFIQAYQYGIAKKGLDLPTQKAVEFALKIAGNTPIPSELKAQQ